MQNGEQAGTIEETTAAQTAGATEQTPAADTAEQPPAAETTEQTPAETASTPAAAEGEAEAAGSTPAAPADPVQQLVSAAIKNAVDNAPASSGGPSDGSPAVSKTIAITKEQAQALGFFNRLMFDSPEQVSAAIFAKMNPESFEEELRAPPAIALTASDWQEDTPMHAYGSCTPPSFAHEKCCCLKSRVPSKA